MPGASLAAIGLGVLSGFSNGAFALPMRYTRKWAWENTWLLFSLFALVLLPWTAVAVFVPHWLSFLRGLPLSYFLPGVIAGIFWGIAQVLYGMGLNLVGIAIGNAVVASGSTIAGTLGPLLVYAPDKLLTSTGLILAAAIVLLVSGIYKYGKAGSRNEREKGHQDSGAPRGAFRTGLTVCLITGPLGTVFIYGIGSSGRLLRATAAAGTKPLFVSCVALAVTFTAGFIANLLYCAYRLQKNRTLSSFTSSGFLLHNSSLAFGMGVLWYAALLTYGVVAIMMGPLGPSVGFGLFVSGTVLFSNLLGWWAGEWKGATRDTVRAYLTGMVLVLVAIVVIAYGAH